MEVFVARHNHFSESYHLRFAAFPDTFPHVAQKEEKSEDQFCFLQRLLSTVYGARAALSRLLTITNDFTVAVYVPACPGAGVRRA